jgi:ectoine hydroxylase-related dioxygenase (phytanoyl-CoA dioxygenase family)
MNLTQKQIDEFYENGFLVLKKVFSTKELEVMAQCTQTLYEESLKLNKTSQVFKGSQFVFEKNSLHRVVWAGAHQEKLLKFGEDLRITGPVSQLLNSVEMDQLINQVHFKMPGDDIEFEWHQDSQHRGYGTSDWKDLNGKGSYVQTLIAIDEVTKEKGPVQFIPTSYKVGHLGLDKVQNNIESVLDISKAKLILMEPGDMALFGPYVPHSSTKNTTTTPRRVLINGYAYPGANSRKYPGEGSGRRVCIKKSKVA